MIHRGAGLLSFPCLPAGSSWILVLYEQYEKEAAEMEAQSVGVVAELQLAKISTDRGRFVSNCRHVMFHIQQGSRQSKLPNVATTVSYTHLTLPTILLV